MRRTATASCWLRGMVVGLGVMLCLAVAVPGAAQDALSGSWDTEICMDAVPLFTSLTSTLRVAYSICGWTFAATMGLDLAGWTTAGFDVAAVLGAFVGRSLVTFNPQAATFEEWDSTVTLVLAGVDLNGRFVLDPIGSGWSVGLSVDAGEMDLAANAFFNLSSAGEVQTAGHCFCFDRFAVDLEFPFGCVANVDALLEFDTTGLGGVTIGVDGLSIPEITWLLFDIEIAFDDGEEGKSLQVTPRLNFAEEFCVTVFADLIGTGTVVEGIDFYGAQFRYNWDAVYFDALTAFDPDDPFGLVTGSYWERYCVGSIADGCCGGLFNFQVCTYFDSASTLLFDWGMTEGSVSVGIGSNFSLECSLSIIDTGIEKLCLGGKISW
ncbi:hypothetical protein JW848_01290 [Candidatus Bipolaricaulota bacterium]|nr:hypothetical protein [Candidatus Bipolaricaulota bacterium]